MERNHSSYKTAQRNFFNWSSKWTQNQHEETPLVPDVVEIVALFQIMGFTMKSFDSSDPNDGPPSWKQDKGLNVIITCGHTGLRCVLEKETECRCPANVSEAVKWEISGTKPKSIKDEIQETGSDMLLPPSSGKQFVISSELNHLFHMVKSSDSNQNEMRTPSLKREIKTQDTDEGPELLPPISPLYYRSMDNLTEISELPNPGMLIKATPKKGAKPLTKYSSSPDVYSLPKTSSPIDGSSEIIQNGIYENLIQIQDLIENVITNYKRDRRINAPLHFNLTQTKGSTESILLNQDIRLDEIPVIAPIDKSGSAPNLSTSSRIKSVRPMCRPPIRSVPVVTVTNSNNLQKKTPVRPVVKNSNTLNSPRPQQPNLTPKTGKYSHIKSTIPKFTSKK